MLRQIVVLVVVFMIVVGVSLVGVDRVSAQDSTGPAHHDFAATESPNFDLVFSSMKEGGVAGLWKREYAGKTSLFRSEKGKNLLLPSISPDGKRIAWLSCNADRSCELWSGNMDGTKPIQLAKEEMVTFLSKLTWAREPKNGKWAVVFSARSGATQSEDLYMVRDDPNAKAQDITNSPNSHEEDPAVDPRTGALVASVLNKGSIEAHLCSLGTVNKVTAPVQVLDVTGNVLEASINPVDGRLAAVEVAPTNGGTVSILYYQNTKGGWSYLFDTKMGLSQYPVWSHDGKHILFTGYSDTGFRLFSFDTTLPNNQPVCLTCDITIPTKEYTDNDQ